MRSRATSARQPSSGRSTAEPARARAVHHPVLDLERSIGNQAVLRLVRAASAPRPAPPAQCSPCADRSERRPPAPRQGDDLEVMADSDGGPAPDTDQPAQCGCSGQQEETREAAPAREDWARPAREGAGPARPQEAGWFTGDWYKTQNTIICDGSGSLGIHESTSYSYGVQDCTRQHESSHRSDWYARYGNEICKGRAKGDLPNFTPSGKVPYADFLKSSECTAWKVGQTCRKEKLDACKDDTCKNYVTTFTTQADAQVKSYCG